MIYSNQEDCAKTRQNKIKFPKTPSSWCLFLSSDVAESLKCNKLVCDLTIVNNPKKTKI